MKKLIVKTFPNGQNVIYVKDIGRVELAKFTYSGGSFVDGNDVPLLMIFQSAEATPLQNRRQCL